MPPGRKARYGRDVRQRPTVPPRPGRRRDAAVAMRLAGLPSQAAVQPPSEAMMEPLTLIASSPSR